MRLKNRDIPVNTVPQVLLMIESSRESGRKLIAGIADYAHHFGPWRFHWAPLGVKGLSGRIEQGAFDGMLVRDVAELESLRVKGVPCVDFSYGSEPEPGRVFVTTDDAAIASRIANDFVRRGFRYFAFCGLRDVPWALQRGRHFKEALQSSGATSDLFWTVAPETPGRKGLAAVAELKGWLCDLPKPVALMVCNDDMARWVVQLCAEAGVRVPEDCAVVGVDNDPVVCGLSDPQLSSVSTDQVQAGYWAAAALDRMMKGEAPERSIILAPVGDLVVRQSSDLIAIDDPAVAKAIRFIQQHGDRKVYVDEVARAAGLNRRTLERRFKAHFDQGILARCREMRCEYLEKLLRERHLSQEQIAFQCGFSEAGHLSRFYTSIRGETPSNYRKRMAAR